MKIKTNEWIRMSAIEQASGVTQPAAYRIARRLGLVVEILGVCAMRRADIPAIAAAATPGRGCWWRRNAAARKPETQPEESEGLTIETDDWVSVEEAAKDAEIAPNTVRRIASRLGISRKVLGVTAIRKADIAAIVDAKSTPGAVWNRNPEVAAAAARRGAAASLKARGLRRSRTSPRAGNGTCGTATAGRRAE